MITICVIFVVFLSLVRVRLRVIVRQGGGMWRSCSLWGRLGRIASILGIVGGGVGDRGVGAVDVLFCESLYVWMVVWMCV